MMSQSVLKIVETIVREVFPGPIHEDLAVALTTVLNRYNIHLSNGSPLTSAPIELTLDSVSIVSKLKVDALADTNSSRWLKRWVERYRMLYEKAEFQKIMQDVADRLSTHPWVDRLEDDWK